MTATGLIDRIEDALRPLAIAANEASWAVNVQSTEETERAKVRADLALTGFLGDRELLEHVEAGLRNGTSPAERRALGAVRDWAIPHQIPEPLRRELVQLEASVEARYTQHRGLVRGAEVSDNEIKRVLRHGDDPAERREAWLASKTVGAIVADDVRRLARLRNEVARHRGYRDWFALAIETMEMTETRLQETLAEADRLTARPFREWKDRYDAALAARFGVGAGELRPWHYDDPFFQDVPRAASVDLDELLSRTDIVELSRQTFLGLGFETAPIIRRSDLFPRDGKCQHAFCMHVDREGDIRVLCNIEANKDWMDTTLHELGHAVYDEGIDTGLRWLLRDCHLTTTEGMALLAGGLVEDPLWLQRVVGMSAADAIELTRPLAVSRAVDLLVFTRWVLVMTSFERELYRDPDGDLDAIWWDLVHRYQRVIPPADRHAPDWAAKIHVACSPVYYHTYLYGKLVAAQLRATLEREAGGIVGQGDAGRFLTERLFRPGLGRRWDKLVEDVTGESLTARFFAAEIERGL